MYITRSLWSFLQTQQKSFIRVTALEMSNQFIFLANYLFCAIALIGIIQENTSDFETSITIMFILSIAKIILSRVTAHVLSTQTSHIKVMLRIDLLHKLFNLGYIEKTQSDELISILTQKVTWLSYYCLEYLPKAIATIITSFIIIMLTIIIYVPLGLIVLICSITILYMYRIIKEKEITEQSCEIDLTGLSTLKAFNIKPTITDIPRPKIIIYSISRIYEIILNCGFYLPFVGGIFCVIAAKITIANLIILFFILTAWHYLMHQITVIWEQNGNFLMELNDILEIYQL
ncbi:MAG: hypothetical protein ATN33_07015 [Epulopiscium sp. Nele67-Bin001]|nr:MAG: hypothetical protein ATN33_07015 [Epulopiscium sp. Nele67-Bin001]